MQWSYNGGVFQRGFNLVKSMGRMKHVEIR